MTKVLMENLVALQRLEFDAGELTPEQAQQAKQLRAKIPAQILSHFDRLMARGKKGVAIVRHRVCSECHISVPIGALGALTFGTDIQLCGNCDRYLYLPEDEPMGVETVPTAPRKTRRKAHADVAR